MVKILQKSKHVSRFHFEFVNQSFPLDNLKPIWTILSQSEKKSLTDITLTFPGISNKLN